MSASKCGNSVTFEDIEKAALKALEPKTVDPVVVSPRAYKMLKRIKKLRPDWNPIVEMEVWAKAYSLGLIEDEE